MDLTYQYAKLRCDFGREPLFCEMGPQVCDNITTDKALQKAYILRNPVHSSSQEGPIYSSHEINTIRAEYATSGCNHAEGGWPKDVNLLDPEATQRYRRKVEKDDPYIHCIMATSKGMERLILQNNALDLYNVYFTSLAPYPAVEHVGCRTVNEFHDSAGQPTTYKRPVSSICWRPEGGNKFAVTYVDADFYMNPRQSVLCSIWDTENANHPDVNIQPPCPLLDLQYNPRQIEMLAGGLMNGQVAVWDLRVQYPRPSTLCPPHVAHREMVRGVRFVNAKNGMEFYSSGPDGVCKWWDCRNMEEPIETVIVDIVVSNNIEPNMAKARGVSCIEFEPTIPSRFMLGTDNGLVITANRKGKSPMDKFPATFNAHLGPVWVVERNPGFLKNFLTVGDWMTRIWSEDCKESSLLMTRWQRHRITFAAWSPTRLSLILMTHSNGKMTIWDLLWNQHEPVLSLQVCEEPLLRVKPHEQGVLVACGSSKGTIYLLELSQNLTVSGRGDKSLMTSMFEREAKRERILESRMREIRLKQRQDAEAGDTAHAHSTAMFDFNNTQELVPVTDEFFQITKKELSMM